MSQFDWPIAKKKKKLKLWRLPKIEDSMERWSASRFGQKRGAIGNSLGEHIGNLGNIYGLG
jgi:hypothetical protein